MNNDMTELRERIAVRSARLSEITVEIKAELYGIDDIIDRVIESVRAWYILPELITRPVIVCLWGLTGTGKTQLTRTLARKLGFYDRFVEVQMDAFSNHYSDTSICGLLSESKVAEGAPGILLLDEFQRYRTLDGHGEDIKVERYMDVWALLSDGRLSPSATFMSELELMLANSALNEHSRALKTNKKDVPTNEETQYHLSPHTAIEFKRALKLKEPVLEVMGWTLETINARMRAFSKDPHNWETDYSRMLIFVCGNLDEMYEETAKRVTDCDTDAEIFHEQTKRLSMIDVKRALGERFKPEQIARLGNNHVIFASMGRATYERLIAETCARYTADMFKACGIRFEISQEVKDQIYANSVFPAQGTRPVFSSIHALLSAPLVNFALFALEHGAAVGDTLSISVDTTGKFLETQFGPRCHHCPVEFELNNLKQRSDPDFRALLAVHEAGHTLVHSVLFGQPPQELKINAASFNGGYNSFINLDAESSRNILDRMCAGMAGFVAETLVFGEEARTSGSVSDIKKVTALAAQYVRHQGFGQRMGRTGVASDGSETVNTDMQASNVEIEKLVQAQFVRAKRLLVQHADSFVRISLALDQQGHVSGGELSEWLGLPSTDMSGVLEPYAWMLQEFSGRPTGIRGSTDSTGGVFSEAFIRDWHAEWARLTHRSAHATDRALKRTADIFCDSIWEFLAPLRMLYWLYMRILRITIRKA